MKTANNIFITGITGFLGSYLAKAYLDHGFTVYGLARPSKNKKATDRVFDILKIIYADEWDPDVIASRLKVVEGDIIYPGLRMNENVKKELIDSIDIMVHSAALAEFNCPYTQIRKINVEGTQFMIDFAAKCKNKGRLKKFNYISTAYIAGKNTPTLDETMYERLQVFNNTYERTKFEAEGLVRTALYKGLNCSIFRPSMIVGSSKDGKSTNFNLFFQPLRLFYKQIFPFFPADMESRLNLINVDTVAQCIVALSQDMVCDVYHIVSPNDVIFKEFINQASVFFHFPLPEFEALKGFDIGRFTPAQRRVVKPFLPYFNFHTAFDARSTYKKLARHGIQIKNFGSEDLLKIFQYYLDCKFHNS